MYFDRKCLNKKQSPKFEINHSAPIMNPPLSHIRPIGAVDWVKGTRDVNRWGIPTSQVLGPSMLLEKVYIPTGEIIRNMVIGYYYYYFDI